VIFERDYGALAFWCGSSFFDISRKYLHSAHSKLYQIANRVEMESLLCLAFQIAGLHPGTTFGTQVNTSELSIRSQSVAGV
jgi:hypothetical protein